MNFEEYLAWLDMNSTLFPVKAEAKPFPQHPGRVLREEFIDKLGFTQTELANRLGYSYASN